MSLQVDADVCIVGAGIVGLAHALEARRRGLRVVVCERDGRAVGASVRNFGHCFVAAMGAGAELDCALAGRDRWLEYGRRARLDVIEAGTLVVARRDDELAVMAGLAADVRRGAELVSIDEVARLAPIPVDGVIGGLHCRNDVRVDPRSAVAGLAQLLADDGAATLMWGAAVLDVAPGLVSTSRGSVRAAHVVVCPGPDLVTLFARELASRPGLTLCKLQMLAVAAPERRRYEPALLTGLSLLRYPGFAMQPAAEGLRERLQHEVPELLAAGCHLIVTQRPSGELLIGDTHEYAPTPSPFSDARLDALVLREACRLLGVPRLDVRERWHGVYPSAPGHPFYVSAPADGVRVVEIVSGIGMTTALGLAPRVLDELLASAEAAVA